MKRSGSPSLKDPYGRMLRIMQEREADSGTIAAEAWFIYILECNDGKFYTGITKNVLARVKKHNDGKGASFTRVRRPVKVIYQETCESRTQALVREYAIKSLSRQAKEALVGAIVKHRAPKKSKSSSRR